MDSCWAYFSADEYFSVGGGRSEDGMPAFGDDGDSDVFCSESDATDDAVVTRNSIMAASGRQGRRKRPPQLVPDGLAPHDHLDVALELLHPFITQQNSLPVVDRALQGPETFSGLSIIV